MTLWPVSASPSTARSNLLDVNQCIDDYSSVAYEGCAAGGNPGSYTCGLWQTFHSMSVSQNSSMTGTEMFASLRQFIAYFFTCTICQEHFLGIMDKVDPATVRTQDDFIFWLYESHNYVNSRLRQEELDAGSFNVDRPKGIFPSPELCPECVDELDNEQTMLPFLADDFYGDNMIQEEDADTSSLVASSVSSSTSDLLTSTWTVTQYYPYFDGEDQELVEPVHGTSITLSLSTDGDSDKCQGFSSEYCNLQGQVSPGNLHFGSYTDLTDTSFAIDGWLGSTTIGIDGPAGEMENNYIYNWWAEEDMKVDWKVLEDGSLELRNANSGLVFAIYKAVCLTKEDCKNMANDSDMGFISGDDFPTKGCFKRDDNVMYWSEGTVSEMAVVGLPGRQERVFCGGSDSSSSIQTAMYESDEKETSSSSSSHTRVGLVVASIAVVSLSLSFLM